MRGIFPALNPEPLEYPFLKKIKYGIYEDLIIIYPHHTLSFLDGLRFRA